MTSPDCHDAAPPSPPPNALTAHGVAAALQAIDTALLTLCGGTGAGVGRSVAGADATDTRVTGAGAGTEDARVHAAGVDPRALGAACRLDDLPELFENVLRVRPDRLDAFTAALVVWALDRPSARDIALMQWSADRATGHKALRAQLRWEHGAEYPLDLGERLWGEGRAPDPHRLATALALAERCARLAPPSRQAGAWAACAWLSWAGGMPQHAADHARHACEREPEHGLGEIVRSFTTVGHRPCWTAAATDDATRPAT